MLVCTKIAQHGGKYLSYKQWHLWKCHHNLVLCAGAPSESLELRVLINDNEIIAECSKIAVCYENGIITKIKWMCVFMCTHDNMKRSENEFKYLYILYNL